MENWKTIKGFDNYEVSTLGNVRRKNCVITYSSGMVTNYKQKLLKQQVNKEKYNRVTLSQNNIQKRFQVHRLVADYFLENINNKPCVNHIDGNGFNNNVSNLEWCTYSENERHSYYILGKINNQRKLTENNVTDIRLNCKKGINHNNRGNVLSFMVKYNVDKKTILNALNRKSYA